MDTIVMGLCFAFLVFVAGYAMGKHDAIGYVQDLFDVLYARRVGRKYEPDESPDLHVAEPTRLHQDRHENEGPGVSLGGGA
jgi:hypothetical protein